MFDRGVSGTVGKFTVNLAFLNVTIFLTLGPGCFKLPVVDCVVDTLVKVLKFNNA